MGAGSCRRLARLSPPLGVARPGVRWSGFCPRFVAGEGVAARGGRGGAGSGRFASPLRGFNRWWSRGVDAFLPAWVGRLAPGAALSSVRRGAVAVGLARGRRSSKSPDPECGGPVSVPASWRGRAWPRGVGVGGPDRAGLRPHFAASTGGGREVWTLSWPPRVGRPASAARHPPSVADADAGGAVRGPQPRTAWTRPGAAGGSRPHLARGPAG